MITLFVPGHSLVHRQPAWTKLLCLMTVAFGASLAPAGPALASLLTLFTVAAYALAGLIRELPRQLWAARWIVVMVGVLLLVFQGPLTATVQTVRVVMIVLLATLITLTTPVSALLDAVERGLRPLRHLGLRPDRIALTLALALSVLPVIAGFARNVREAQLARGTPPSVRATVVPLLVMTLKHADELADALSARGVG